MKILYKIANFFRRTYWFIFCPHTQGVKCLIENNGEYLLIQTSYSGKYWTLPGGGIKSKETSDQAAKREVHEELGVNLDKVTLIGQYESSVEYKKDIVFLFHAEVLAKDFVISTEVSIAQWFKKDSLPENQSRALKESLKLV